MPEPMLATVADTAEAGLTTGLQCRDRYGMAAAVSGWTGDVKGLAFSANDTLYVGSWDNIAYRVDSEPFGPMLSGGPYPPAVLDISGTAAADYFVDYKRDKLGRITEKTEDYGYGPKTTRYEYDLAGRLSEVWTEGQLEVRYTYDENGNRLSAERAGSVTTAEYDAQDRLVRYGDTQFTYTLAGDLLTKTTPGGTTEYHYDMLGNLREVTLPDGSLIEYIIDGRNRRIGKKVDGQLVQGFLYKDELNPVAELDGDGNVIARFIYADKANVPAYIIKVDPLTGAEHAHRIISDHLGSPRLVIDTSTGVIVQRMEYTAFGEVVQDTNPGFQPFGFAGGIYDRDTDLVRFGARDYSAAYGRWTKKDPILFEGNSPNLYEYTLGDAVNWLDPQGTRRVKGRGHVPAMAGTGDVTVTVSVTIGSTTITIDGWKVLWGQTTQVGLGAGVDFCFERGGGAGSCEKESDEPSSSGYPDSLSAGLGPHIGVTFPIGGSVSGPCLSLGPSFGLPFGANYNL